MKTSAPLPDDTEVEPPWKPLTREEAQRLREQNPSLSPWKVVLGQVLAGVLVALLAWGFTGRANVAWSAAYGALAVVIPAAVFARGLMGRFASLNAGTAALGFMLWEVVKLVLSVALMMVAPGLVPELNWLALLIGLVVAMKVYWLALAWAPRPKKI